jgi:hypothetical protein
MNQASCRFCARTGGQARETIAARFARARGWASQLIAPIAEATVFA